jgi:hypothetical protein
MAVKKNLKTQGRAIILKAPTDSDLPSRMKKISEQTGLDTVDLFHKWVLQEESLIGITLSGREQTEDQTAPPRNR